MEEKTRQEVIHEKGFDLTNYGRIKVGSKTLDDAVLSLGAYSKMDRHFFHKGEILKALIDKDISTLRLISSSFYVSSGIYQKLCNYVANLYRYDWYIVPEIYSDTVNNDKVIKEFNKLLNYLDNSHIKKISGDIALTVVKNGAYYGYKVDNGDRLILQELPASYCRSRYMVNGNPAVEFNMRFFDDKFPDTKYRAKVLKLFPKEFQKGYALYRAGKLQQDYYEDLQGWYLLDINKTCKFSFNNDDIPLFVNVIPAILDLDAAQDLDRRKQMQKLLKIIIQKLPMDKNNDLVFDLDEARDIHNNAVEMLRQAIGVDVLTTFADIDSIDLSDKTTTAASDELEKVERGIFNAAGVSQNIFNTSGNMSLEKSILNDESVIRTLLLQLADFFDDITQTKSTNFKKWNFKFYMLETTQYNYKDLSKLYKEQVQLGYSKMLPQIALGHSQSSIINTAYFENSILNLSAIMIPPLMSSSINGEDILNKVDNKEAGRPEKADDEKSDKTIQNIESQS